MDRPAEQVTPTDTIKIDNVRGRLVIIRGRLVQGRPLAERPVRPVLVEMRDVGREDVVEMAAAEDQDPVEALAADAANPAFCVRPRLRRPHRRLDHPDPGIVPAPFADVRVSIRQAG